MEKVTSHTHLQQDAAKNVSGINHWPHVLVLGWHRLGGDIPVPGPGHRPAPNPPSRVASASRTEAAARGGIREVHGMDPSCEDRVSGHRRCLMCRFTKAWLKRIRGGINCYRWKRWCRDAGELSLEKLCTGARSALGRSLQRDSAPSTSPLCHGLDTQRVTTRRTKEAKIMVRTGRNSRAPLLVFAPARSVSPPRENLPAALWAP